MRKYQPIWERIKETGHCEIVTPSNPALQRRIVRGVSKEKDEDYGFKVLAAEKWKSNKLKILIKHSSIVFILDHATTLEDL